MTDRDWNELQAAVETRGHLAGQQLEAGVELFHHLAAANNILSEDGLEWLAGMFQMLPLAPTRTSCSSRGEAIFRKLAIPAGHEEGWMPFGTLGPLLICAHYNPASTAFWGIPQEFIIPVLIPRVTYDGLRKDVMERLDFKPLDAQEPIHIAVPLPRNEGMERTLQWLLDYYPFDGDNIRSKLEQECRQLTDAAPGDALALRKLSHNLGLALYYLATGEFCFNAEYAPPQSIFPEALLEKHGVYPLYCGSRIVYLLATDKNSFAFEDEWLSSGNDAFDFRTVLADAPAILSIINRERSRIAATGQATVEGELTYSDVANIVDIDVQEIQRINPSSMNSSPEQVVHWVLYRAITGRASDLHIEKYFNTARFRARIDGELKVIHSCSEEQLPRFVSLIKNYSNMGQRRQDAQDARFSLLLGKRRVDCRVSAIPVRKDLQKITIRFLDKQDGVKKLTELHLSPRQTLALNDAMGRDQGLILVTGPTGSGKTTTLYALLNSINTDNINIQTIEDPIEYEIEGMNQTQTDPHNGINFAEGLRRLLRADPDVLLIGECRDEETANAAVNAALTGHLVLTTLHANDCLRAVSRLISMGIPPYLLADALALTQAQRLVRKLCPFCKQPIALTPEIRTIFRANRIEIRPDIQLLYTKNGCSECGETGYSGRMALMEMCPVDGPLSDMVANNAPQTMMRKVAFNRGVLSLYQEGLMRVLTGDTSLEEVSCLSYTALSEEDADHGDAPPVVATEEPDVSRDRPLAALRSES